MKMKKLLNRRKFIKTAGAGIATMTTSGLKKQRQFDYNQASRVRAYQSKINKREVVLNLVDENHKQDYIPARWSMPA